MRHGSNRAEGSDVVRVGDGGTDEKTGVVNGGAESKILRFSLRVTRMDKIRNEYIGETAQMGRFGEKRRGLGLRWSRHVRRKDDGYIGRMMMRLELPERGNGEGKT